MRRLLCALALVFLCGCTTGSVSNYIPASENPYSRKVYGDFEKIVVVAKNVLSVNGWTVVGESHPSVYERASDEYKESFQDLLIFSRAKKGFSSSHINLILHKTAEGADVEVRMRGSRSKKLVNNLLTQIEQAMLSK